ncbi:MAG: SWIM zinc finger family protein [Bacteriovoracaceae bacterium]|nr:SWIM zinc finger family protein [Bacteriovoracaceae bacterium]
MSRWSWGPYVSVAEKRRKAAKAVAKLSKRGNQLLPVSIDGRQIAKTFWGKAWCDHLESYIDYENRLPRGRTYVRNGSVLDLKVYEGKIEALVQGSALYKVQIEINNVDSNKWKSIASKCSGAIGSVIELLQGKLSSSVMTTITDKNSGLFPSPKEIKLKCSCPDWAEMCKHVAAVLYGIGSRLDSEPQLLFTLRKVDHMELVSKAALSVPGKRSTTARVIEDQDLSDLFGIQLNDDAKAKNEIAKKPKISTAPKRKVVAKKKVSKKKKVKKKRPTRS